MQERKNMNKITKKSLFCLILMFIFTFSLTQTSQALEENMTRERELQKGDTVEGTHVFAMPDNGWNTVSIKLDYYESYYSENNKTNTFPFRQKMYVIKKSGVGSGSISLDVSNVLHTNGSSQTIISGFEQGAILIDSSKWDWGWYYYNTTVKSYSKSTNYKGQVTYLLMCPDAIPASATGSARISLATQ